MYLVKDPTGHPICLLQSVVLDPQAAIKSRSAFRSLSRICGDDNIARPIFRQETFDPLTGNFAVQTVVEFPGRFLAELRSGPGTRNRIQNILRALARTADAMHLACETGTVEYFSLRPERVGEVPAGFCDCSLEFIRRQWKSSASNMHDRCYYYPPEALLDEGSNIRINVEKVAVYSWGAMALDLVLGEKIRISRRKWGSLCRTKEKYQKRYLDQAMVALSIEACCIKKRFPELVLRALAYRPEDRPRFAELISNLCQPRAQEVVHKGKLALKLETKSRLTNRVYQTIRWTRAPVCDLSSQNIADTDCAALVSAIRLNRAVKRIRLYNNKIVPTGASQIARALPQILGLESLDLASNPLQVCGATSLARMLGENVAPVKEISLRATRIGTEGTIMLAEALRGNHTLRVLNLSENGIGDSEARTLFEACIANDTLHSLEIFDNAIADVSCPIIQSLLAANTALANLDLNSNLITGSGAADISKGLSINNRMHKLYLSHNLIKAEGAALIASALRRNRTLRVLSLSENAIGDLGAGAVADAIRGSMSKTAICELFLRSCGITDKRARTIARMLRRGKMPARLVVSGNLIGDEGATMIANVMVKRQGTVVLANSMVGDAGKMAVRRILGGKSAGGKLYLGSVMKSLKKARCAAGRGLSV